MKLKQQWQKKRRELGLTLIEASMVLALSAVVVAGVMMYYQSASENNRVQNAASELGIIQTIVAGVSSNGNSFDGLSTSVLTNNTAIPPSLQQSGTAIDPWGGHVDLNNVTSQYIVAFENVPEDACLTLLGQQLGGDLVAIGTDTATAGTVTPSVAEAMSICGSSGGSRTIAWTFN